MAEKFEVRTAHDQNSLLKHIADIQPVIDKPVTVVIKQGRATRSLNANALYWVWIRQLANIKSLPEEQMHRKLKHLLLWYVEEDLGHGIVVTRQVSTKELGSARFCQYMQDIDMACAEQGIYLPRPEDSEYDLYLKMQRGG